MSIDAIATVRNLPAPFGQVAVVQPVKGALAGWRARTQSFFLLVGAAGLVLSGISTAYFWQAWRARHADQICEKVRKRLDTALSRGRQVGPEASISKVVAAAQCQDIASFGADLFEEAGILTGGDAAAGGLFPHGLLSSPGMRIAAGTDEILRNIIAERVLGLPGDIRVDRDRAFQEIPQAPR